MLLSMALVAAVVLAGFWFVAWQRPEVQGPIRPDVDVSQLFDQVAVAQPFPVLQPMGLGDSWAPTSAWFQPAGVDSRIDGGELHVGYLTPAGSYAEVRQTDGAASQALEEWVGPDAAKTGDVQIEGQQWSVVESEDAGKQALVLDVGGTVVVVTGKADRAELEELAGSLR
jgi:hypothetical protein